VTFNASAAAGAVSGVRTVVVVTAAGESTSVQLAGNIIRIATEIGPTYANISSPVVGLVIGSSSPAPENVSGTLLSGAVGVTVGTPPVDPPVNSTLAGAQVGVVVGAAAQTMSPAGWLQGASGTVAVTGRGLDAVDAVVAQPATGILLGTPTVSNGGTLLSVPISVAPDAPTTLRELRLGAAGNGRISFVSVDAGRFGIGSLPTMGSVSPIVFEQGKSVALTVRGSNLKGVSAVVLEPAAGVRAVSSIVWSQDGLGELLTVSMQVDADAPLGSRVVRLQVPGGGTSATPTPANTVNVVAQQ
jgi:hypothetical protein